MGFPSRYPEYFIPREFINDVSFINLIRAVFTTLLHLLGLHDLVEADIQCPEPWPELAPLIHEVMPAIRFDDIRGQYGTGSEPGPDLPKSCVVCLCDFKGRDQVRRLNICRHIFHQRCLDRWIGHDQKTCPLCRTSYVPDHLVKAFNERGCLAPAFPDFGGEFCLINSFFNL